MKYLILLLVTMVLTSCESLPFWEADNPLEETIEEVIEAATGYDIDLSPSTPEGNRKPRIYHFQKTF